MLRWNRIWGKMELVIGTILKEGISVTHLNLARKWRSKQFDQVVGQDLSVRMLQNSLYLNQIFPVYLFSGQRGCGKTTTARIFAGALNCEQLEAFRADPKSHKIPCLQCASCKAMAAGNHPDFIEIDAASHTGVDNVRNIIDAASLLPVMGSKRIYLIDEAHMLSKAAFNAFLKILEEPPASVVFMLATTDPEKIIETVRSRCFQLFFPALKQEQLVEHMQAVCTAENIRADLNALKTIVQETEGSARDALNLLEQVRFSHATVTKEAVLKVLGHIPEHVLLDMVGHLMEGDPTQLLRFLQERNVGDYTPLAVWQKIQELLRAILLVKHGVAQQVAIEDKDRVGALARRCSLELLTNWLQILYDNEMTLLKTTAQQGVLEMMLLQMCQGQQPQIAHAAPQSIVQKPLASVHSVEQPATVVVEQLQDERWSGFVQKIEQLSDPLLNSIFKQAHYKSYDVKTHTLVVAFAQDATFFGEWLQETRALWIGFLQELFGQEVIFAPVFEKGLIAQKAELKQQPAVKREQAAGSSYRASAPQVKKANVVNVSDKEVWKTANTLLDAFGGTVVEIEGDYEKVE